ncbi:hypothetical protein QBC36DRAFT_334595 [Triangularia setosa]|uniref:Uncharacterized protein n=1 Tax=Triangularia setosa TaxID=2587417 RepID=A0AAN7A6C7_9PEZI|nr:hypothetical protein QBC36DRAFT_334595 [Podospora setosa]
MLLLHRRLLSLLSIRAMNTQGGAGYMYVFFVMEEMCVLLLCVWLDVCMMFWVGYIAFKSSVLLILVWTSRSSSGG